MKMDLREIWPNYTITSCHQCAGQNHKLVIANEYF